MKNYCKPTSHGWRFGIMPLCTFFLSVFCLTGLLSCTKERGMNEFHIQGQLVELGTNIPLRHSGVKFIVFKSYKSSHLSNASQIIVDSFETDANGRYDHVFKTEDLLENFKVKVATTIPGYFPNGYSYSLVNSSTELKSVFLPKRALFKFVVDNRNGFPSDEFSFIMPGMVQFEYFFGNQLHEYTIEQPAFADFTINFGDFRNDTNYLIPIFINQRDSFTYTHIIQ